MFYFTKRNIVLILSRSKKKIMYDDDIEPETINFFGLKFTDSNCLK